MRFRNTFLIAILSGAVQLSASPITFSAVLSGANENPVVNSPATGFALVTIDSVANTMEVNVIFSGLTSNDTAAHIHCCVAPGGNAGVTTALPAFPGFPLAVTAGSYDQVLNMTLASSYNPAFVTAQGSIANAEATLFAGIAAGNAYLNIHTSNFPGGEIRGFLVATPEPATLSLMGLALGGLLAFGRIRRGRA